MTNAQAIKFYKNRFREIGSPALGPWGVEAIDHWKANLPKYHAYLTSLNSLKEAAAIAEHNAKEMDAKLASQGVDPYAAREIVMKEFILIEAEPPLRGKTTSSPTPTRSTRAG